jgi:AcrR family transcriptional regulator
MARRTGRRPGNPDTREAILVAAREIFAERGYDAASIRAIATSAGVDPALVYHYFGTKDQLFADTVGLPVEPAEVVSRVFASGPDGAGERLVRFFLSVWENPVTGPQVEAMVRSVLSHRQSARLLRDFFVTQILRRVLPRLDVDPAEAPLRATLSASQLFGLAMTRYILKLEPLASVPPDEIIAMIGPTIQRYLTGDLGGAAVDREPPAGSAPGQPS